MYTQLASEARGLHFALSLYPCSLHVLTLCAKAVKASAETAHLCRLF